MNKIKDSVQQVKAFAPATCANIAVGFDILGFAFDKLGDYVTLKKRDDQKIVIESIISEETLPFTTQQNTASLVIEKLCQELSLDIGFSIVIEKGIPLCSGMGGSAASAVAALVAFNHFLKEPLSLHELARFALMGEQQASGAAHPDNIVPCLFGGFTLTYSQNPMKVIQLPIPKLYCVLLHPHMHVSTRSARDVLKSEIALKDYVKQSAHLASFIAALYEQDDNLLSQALVDDLIEPQRAQFVPNFYKIKEAALQAGALGMSFSGSGPALFAFAKTEQAAQAIGQAMQKPLQEKQIESNYWVAPISKNAAHVVFEGE
jgi:homoserine kinase